MCQPFQLEQKWLWDICQPELRQLFFQYIIFEKFVYKI